MEKERIVTLQCKPLSRVCNDVLDMMNNAPGIKEIFFGKEDRLLASKIVSLIVLNNEEKIGFLNILEEDVPGINFIDMGIKEQYRNKGYGKQSIKELLESIQSIKYFVGETKIDNISSNKVAKELNADKIIETNDRIFYLFGKEKDKNMFYEEGKLEELKSFIEITIKEKIYCKRVR